MKGIIQQIKDGDNVHNVTPEEAEKWNEFAKFMSEIPVSKCHSATVHLGEDGITCTYCGEVCELNETP